MVSCLKSEMLLHKPMVLCSCQRAALLLQRLSFLLDSGKALPVLSLDLSTMFAGTLILEHLRCALIALLLELA